MKHISTPEQQLLREIEQLSTPYFMELQNFIQYLEFKQANMTAAAHGSRILRPEGDPILRTCGLIEVAPFSEAMDDILYGAV